MDKYDDNHGGIPPLKKALWLNNTKVEGEALNANLITTLRNANSPPEKLLDNADITETLVIIVMNAPHSGITSRNSFKLDTYDLLYPMRDKQVKGSL